jgi:hypothetical protein
VQLLFNESLFGMWCQLQHTDARLHSEERVKLMRKDLAPWSPSHTPSKQARSNDHVSSTVSNTCDPFGVNWQAKEDQGW